MARDPGGLTPWERELARRQADVQRPGGTEPPTPWGSAPTAPNYVPGPPPHSGGLFSDRNLKAAGLIITSLILATVFAPAGVPLMSLTMGLLLPSIGLAVRSGRKGMERREAKEQTAARTRQAETLRKIQGQGPSHSPEYERLSRQFPPPPRRSGPGFPPPGGGGPGFTPPGGGGPGFTPPGGGGGRPGGQPDVEDLTQAERDAIDVFGVTPADLKTSAGYAKARSAHRELLKAANGPDVRQGNASRADNATLRLLRYAWGVVEANTSAQVKEAADQTRQQGGPQAGGSGPGQGPGRNLRGAAGPPGPHLRTSQVRGTRAASPRTVDLGL